jgi:hypothetical protein
VRSDLGSGAGPESKQPLPYDAPEEGRVEPRRRISDLAADDDLDLEVDEDAEENPDDEVDLGGDDDIGVPGAGSATKKIKTVLEAPRPCHKAAATPRVPIKCTFDE